MAEKIHEERANGHQPAPADRASISGTVAGPDAAPFRGAFVQARNAKTKITVSVHSASRGRYRIDNLPAGDYRLAIKTPGFKADAKRRRTLAPDEGATQDFALQKGS